MLHRVTVTGRRQRTKLLKRASTQTVSKRTNYNGKEEAETTEATGRQMTLADCVLPTLRCASHLSLIIGWCSVLGQVKLWARQN